MCRYNLEDTEWRALFFSEIFQNIYIAKSTDQNKLLDGNVPFIGRSSINNGLQGEYFVDESKINKQNSLTISMVGEPKCFYQPYDFTCSQNILVLQNKFLNNKSAKFIIPIIDEYLKTKGYGYGYPVGKARVLRNKLLLPVDKKGISNWHFMEEYIKERENKQRQDLKEYYKNRLLDLVICPEVLQDVEWGEFFLGDLFEIQTKSANGLNHLEKDGKSGISYVGATNKNNGVMDFVREISTKTYKGNAIAFIRNGEGSMGYSVYKKEEFMATQDISVGYNSKLNQYSAKFITTVSDRVRGKYTFGYKRNQTRLKKEILSLPINKKGNPNWTYMENFIKKIEQKQIKNILKHLDNYI